MRDFYPPQMALQNYIREIMSSVSKRYGYEEYGASILEETDIYRAKTGEEIVNEQTYSFTDRGGRDVTLRPEMTPTVARMIAGRRREVSLPVRWFSIPNCFRYEKPQRGRVREFWQLNVDLLGDDSVYADAEIISVAYDIMREFGADPSRFVIRINSRVLMNEFFGEILRLNGEQSYRLSKLIDKKEKISPEEFERNSRELVGEKYEDFIRFISTRFLEDLSGEIASTQAVKDLGEIFEVLKLQGIANMVFDPTLMRGFDYYTGMVFEVFDTGNENPRSLFGGGRFDKLVDLFGAEPISAVGFGMGDLPIEGYLETYGLLPNIEKQVKLRICVIDGSVTEGALVLAQELRAHGLAVALDFSNKKIEKKLKNAKKSNAEFMLCFGKKESEKCEYVIQEIETGRSQTVSKNDLLTVLAKS